MQGPKATGRLAGSTQRSRFSFESKPPQSNASALNRPCGLTKQEQDEDRHCESVLQADR